MEDTLDMNDINSLKEIHPLMDSIFPNVVWILNLPRDKGFTSDLECVRCWGYVFDFKVKMDNVCSNPSAFMHGGILNQISELKEVGKTLKVDEGLIFQSNLAKIQKLLYEIIERKMKLTEPTLKVVRFAKHADLTEIETRALFFMVASYICIDTSIHQVCVPKSMAQTVQGLEMEDVLEFLTPTKKFMKAGLFSYFDEAQPLTQTLLLKSEIAYLLAGFEVKETRLLQYGGTFVGEFLEEEKKLRKKLNGDFKEEEKEMELLSSFVIVDEAKRQDDKSVDKKRKDKIVEEDEQLNPNVEFDKEPLNIDDFLRREVEAEKEAALLVVAKDGIGSDNDVEDKEEEELKPYKDNLEYLEDASKAIFYETKYRERKKAKELDSGATFKFNFGRGFVFGGGGFGGGKPCGGGGGFGEGFGEGFGGGGFGGGGFGAPGLNQDEDIRRLKNTHLLWKNKSEQRMTYTRETTKWLPRLMRLSSARGFVEFETKVMLLLIYHLLHPPSERDLNSWTPTVGSLVRSFSDNLKEQIACRKYFGKNATLIKEGIVLLSPSALEYDVMNVRVSIDRRMFDFLLGLDTDFSEIVEGSHLYQPNVDIDNVILPTDQKDLIMETVRNFQAFKTTRTKMGLTDLLSYGGGVTMMFYGASGTGKTMMANAVATDMEKKILLINFPTLNPKAMEFIFREAKINNAIVFFDECDSLFQSRDMNNYSVNLLLTSLEKHDGLVIMATNRAFDLDEAMHRRITLALEFRKPDLLLRHEIWKANLPEKMVLADDVDLRELSDKFELAGGFIKNAILSAVGRAVAREGEGCKVNQKDFLEGCRLQLRSKLRMVDFHHRIVPKRSLDDMVLDESTKKLIKEVITFDKAKQVLYSQWGYEDTFVHDRGITVCFYGPPGIGKTLGAEAIAYSTGKPLKLVNTSALVSKYVGDTSKNLEAVFDEGKLNDAVLVFDDAEGLFGQRTNNGSANERHFNMDVGLLLYQMEHYPGIVILCTNLVETIDQAFHRRLRFTIPFPKPEQSQRAKLWRKLIPQVCPIDEDVNFELLGTMFDFAGGSIKSAILRAASRAALREVKEGSSRRIKMEDLLEAGKEELNKLKTQTDPAIQHVLYH